MSQNNFSRRAFLKAAAGLGALSVFPFRVNSQKGPTARTLTLYVGTYTSGKSEGIYIYRMNMFTGELKYFKSVKSVEPSFLTVDKKRRCLYAVNEVTEFEGKPSGAVSAFAIDRLTGDLKLLNQKPSLGGAPCHVIVDGTNKFVLAANYVGGNVSVIRIQPDGSLGLATDIVQHQGSSIINERQDAPHAHCVTLDRANRYVFATDLGLDRIMIHRFDAARGKLVPGKQPWALLKPGAGPRHFTFHPNGRYAYVISELNSTLTAFTYDRSHGVLSETHVVSTLPTGFSGVSYCADVHVSPSGRFLYGSNRGHDSIVVFAIDVRTGKLNYIEHVPTQGSWPRNFTVDPTGTFLLVANQKSDTIVTLRIDSRTGRLKPTGHVTEVPTPVCLKLVPFS